MSDRCLRLARAFVTFVALILAACTSASPTPSPSPSPSPSASASAVSQLPPPSVVPWQSGYLATPTVAATPSPIAVSPTPAPRGPSRTVEGKSAVWAPDGAHFATSIAGENIYGADGSLVRQCQFSSPRWLDADHVMGIGGDQEPYRAFICDIHDGTTSTIDLPEPPVEVLANGHGTVAISWPRDNAWPDQHYDYVVWSDGVSTKPRDGYPQAWSSDGSRLALLHQFGRVRSPGGWVSVVSWPGLRSLLNDSPPWASGYVYFDPSCQHVGYDTSSDTEEVVRVADLSTGNFVDLPGSNRDSEWWTADGLISIVGSTPLTTSYEPDGTLVGTTTSPGRVAVASADGSTVVFGDWDNSTGNLTPYVTVLRNGDLSSFQAPTIGLGGFAVSPDGLGVVVPGDDREDLSYVFTDYWVVSREVGSRSGGPTEI